MTTVHASSATKGEKTFCAREYALHLIHPTITQKSGFISTALRVTFDTGKDTQRRLNEEWIPDRVIGNWRCRVCGATKEFCKRGVTCCGSADYNSWEYEEVRFTSEYSGISGGVDLLVDMGNSLLTLVEVKTMEKDGFKTLAAPLAEHRVRTSLYLRLVAESNHPKKDTIDTSRGFVLYIIKGFGVKDEEVALWRLHDSSITPFKEYLVLRDDSATDAMSDNARAYKLFKESGATIPEGICPTAMCKRATSCAVAKQCFSGKFNEEFTL